MGAAGAACRLQTGIILDGAVRYGRLDVGSLMAFALFGNDHD